MARVLTLGGSPSKASRTALLLRHVGARLSHEGGYAVRHLAVRELPPGPWLAADTTHPVIARAVAEVAEVAAADAVVVGTPVYKAAYRGLLKTFLDLLPQTALAGKRVLPLVTGGSTAHVLALDYALRPVLTALGSEHVLRGWFVLEKHLVRDTEGPGTGPSNGPNAGPSNGPGADPGDGVTLAPAAATGVEQAVAQLTTALATRTAAPLAA